MNRGQGRSRSQGVGLMLILTASLWMAGCRGEAPSGGPLDTVITFGEVGGSPGQFSYPRAIDHDGSSLWVIDKSARVQRINPQTGESPAGWRMPEWQKGKPIGVTIWQPQGGPPEALRIFIADTHYHRVMEYAPGAPMLAAGEVDAGNDGQAWGERYHLLSRFGGYGTGPAEFTYPTDVAVLGNASGTEISRIYVSEYGGADRISVFTPSEAGIAQGVNSWRFEFSIGRFGSGSDPNQPEFSRPQSIVIDTSARELIVADACNHRLVRLTLEGLVVGYIGGRDHVGTGIGEMRYPYGLTLLGDRTVLVAEYGNNRLQRFDLDSGASLGIFGEQGRGEGQLAIPWGVTTLDGTSYVLDSGNNRVHGIPVPTGRAAAREQLAKQSEQTVTRSDGGPL